MAFISGVRTAVLMTRVPRAWAARSKSAPNLPSRSRMMKRGPLPNGVASRSRCAVHCWVGARVAETCRTSRVPRLMMKKAKMGRNQMS